MYISFKKYTVLLSSLGQFLLFSIIYFNDHIYIFCCYTNHLLMACQIILGILYYKYFQNYLENIKLCFAIYSMNQFLSLLMVLLGFSEVSLSNTDNIMVSWLSCVHFIYSLIFSPHHSPHYKIESPIYAYIANQCINIWLNLSKLLECIVQKIVLIYSVCDTIFVSLTIHYGF